MRLNTPLPVASAALALTLMATACTGGATVNDDDEAPRAAGDPGSLNAGYVSGIDQMGLPAAQEQGFFEDQNLDVTIANGFPTGVAAVEALHAGQVDIVQIGVPGIMDLGAGGETVFVGHYSGSPTQRNIDDTLAVVAGEDSDIDPEDLSTLKGTKIATSFGTINHLYILGILQDLRIDVEEVTLVNTPPPEMAIALETGAVDALVSWDPIPLLAADQVEGAYDVVRGGAYIPYVGYLVTTPQFLEERPEAVSAFLAARAAADQWMRQDPEGAADIAVRWLDGTDPEVALAAMEYNTVQLDPRFSACNYLALDTVAKMLDMEESVDFAYNFDVSEVMQAGLMLQVMEDYPELFSDLPEIPEQAQVQADHNFVEEVDKTVCEV